MANNRQLFRRALAKWDSLHEAGSYSQPISVGRVAILFSCFDYADKKSDVDEFEAEAYEISDVIVRAAGRAAVTAVRDSSAFDDAIADPTVASIVTIGHGALPYLYINNDAHGRDGNNRYDWLDASRVTTHLKTGSFVQRQCGNETRVLSVPLGTFVMASHASVSAPVGSNFSPAGLDDIENDLVRPVCSDNRLSYARVKEYFDQKNFIGGWLGDDQAVS